MKKSYVCAGTAIFCWSTIAAVSKILLKELNNIQLMWMSSLIAAVFLFVLNLLRGNFKKHTEYKLKDYILMVLIGLPGTFFYYVFFYAGTDILMASEAFIINYLWPIMSVLFACILLKEKLTARKVIAIIISFCGVAIVAGGAIRAFDGKALIGAFYCILGAISYGVFTALNQKKSYDKMLALMVSYIATFILTTLINLFNKGLFVPTAIQLVPFLWNGIFTVAIATVCWAVALESGKTAKISNLAYITPFLSLVWTSIFLKEKITINALAGLVVIMVGILIQLKGREES